MNTPNYQHKKKLDELVDALGKLEKKSDKNTKTAEGD
jgi:hypothetical protein